MTDQQQSLAGYRGKVQEPGEFANPNEGKSFLNANDEYILQLTKFPHRISQKQPKEKRDGTKYFEDVEKAVCEFEERDSKNIVTAFFRIDKLNFADEDAYTSAAIRFFQKIGNPLPENVYPDWTQYFIVGMRFRSRVVVGMDKSPSGTKTPNGRYYLDVPTCRKLLPSDTAGESFAKDTQPQTSTASLSNALLLAKGAPNRQEAIMKILEASGSTEFMQAFIVADKAGQIKYPI
jgi:hypothetical protein